MLVIGGECHQTGALAFSPLLKQAGALLAVYVIIFLLLYFVPHPERKIN